MLYKTAYKVVRYVDGKLASAMSKLLPPELVVYYELGEVARPTIGRLMAWPNLDVARTQASILHNNMEARFEVWKAQVGDPQFIAGAIQLNYVTAEYARHFWHHIAWWETQFDRTSWVPLCDVAWACLGIELQECVDVYGSA